MQLHGRRSRRAFLKNERLAEKREYVEKVAARIDSVVSEKHAAFVEEKGLGADKDKALAELEADVNDKARALAESVMTGEKMWWEIRPEARTLFDDAMGKLTGVLGAELANDYLDRFSDDFPMLRRWRSGDTPWGGGGAGAGAAAGTASAGSGG